MTGNRYHILCNRCLKEWYEWEIKDWLPIALHEVQCVESSSLELKERKDER